MAAQSCLHQRLQSWAAGPASAQPCRRVQAGALPIIASLRRLEGGSTHMAGRQHRRADPAVEPPAALAATANRGRGVDLGSGSGDAASASSSRSSSSSVAIPCGSGGRLRVAVDVDEVLGRFLHSLNQYCLEAYDMRYDVSDYHVYDFAKVWACGQEESNHRVHDFFTSHHFAAGIETIPGAYESLARLRGACDLMVVTSRQHIIQEPTLEWLEEHFPQVFLEVHFGNHFALEGKSRKKSEICRAIGAEVLIDDNPSYAVECADAGIHVLLYDWHHAYPWSKTADGPCHDRITRVRDWAEVEQVLGVLAAQRASSA